MEFSVLMSVYSKDQSEHVKTALESVTVLQTVKPAQVVVVCDGPIPFDIDGIIESVSKNEKGIEFTVLKKEKNEGLASALDDGIDLCKYEWIARMDSDDIAMPQRFEKQTGYILAHPGIDVLGSHIAEFENEPGDMESERRVGVSHEEISCMAKRRTPINHMTVFYKKSAILQVGKYDISFGKLEDYKLWVDLLVSGKRFANIDEVLVFARVGNGFIERRSNKREIYDWDMLQKYLLEKHFVTKKEAFMNKVYIRAFIYMPAALKKIAYKFVLRK